MRVSYNWLQEYVDCDLPPAELADRLTMAGLEVEGIEKVGSELKGVVVAQIASITPHPQADRLSFCRVMVGKEAYPIVCGARNMKEGDKVALAMVGSELPEGLKIKKAEIVGFFMNFTVETPRRQNQCGKSVGNIGSQQYEKRDPHS